MKLKNSYKSLFIFKLIILLICVSVFCYLLYRDIVFHDNELSSYYFKYHIISSLLIFCSLIFFFLKNEIFFNFITVIISLIVTFFLIEIYLFFIQSKFDTNQQIEYLISDKNNQNLKSAIMPGKFFYEDLKIKPLSGLASVNTVYCNESGYFSKYFSDQYGFNNPKDAWGKENDVILIGDSFVHGAFVKEKDSIAGNLRGKNKNTVINLSYKGNGPLIKFATLKEYLDKAKPKKVLWFYFEGNDLYELTDELQNKTLKEYLKEDQFTQNLSSKQSKIDKMIMNELKQLEKKSFKKFLKLNTIRSLTIEKATEYPDWEQKISNEFFEIMKKTKNILERRNIEFYFIYLPEYDRYSKNIGSDKNYNDYEKVIQKISNLKIEIIDIHEEVFKEYSDPLALFPFRSDGHYNEIGYTLIGKKILNLIDKP